MQVRYLAFDRQDPVDSRAPPLQDAPAAVKIDLTGGPVEPAARVGNIDHIDRVLRIELGDPGLAQFGRHAEPIEYRRTSPVLPGPRNSDAGTGALDNRNPEPVPGLDPDPHPICILLENPICILLEIKFLIGLSKAPALGIAQEAILPDPHHGDRGREEHPGPDLSNSLRGGVDQVDINHLPDPVPLLVATWAGEGEPATFDEDNAALGALGLLQPGELNDVLWPEASVYSKP